MKKYFYTFILVCICGFYSFSQRQLHQINEISFGAKAGVNMAYVPEVLDEIKENNPKIGFYAGGFMQFQLSKKLYLLAEVLYSQQGSKTKFQIEMNYLGYDLPPFDADADFSLDYINAPLVLRWNFYNNFYLGFGAQAGYLLRDNVHLTSDIDVVVNGVRLQTTIDEEGNVEEVSQTLEQRYGTSLNIKKKNSDFSLVFDGGYEFHNGISINGRYTLGLTNVLEGEGIDADPRNSVFSLGVGYIF